MDRYHWYQSILDLWNTITLAQTRQKTAMEEAVKTLMEEQQKWIQQQIAEQNQRIEAQQQQMTTQMLNQLRIQDEKLQHHHLGSGTDVGVRNNLHFNPKIEFPEFDGTDPKGWIKKCIRYFSLCQINDEQKVDLAALHLKGPVEVWFAAIFWVEETLCGKSLLWMCVPDLETTW